MSIYATYTDAQLLTLLTADDQQAFDEIYSRHWGLTYRLAFGILRKQEVSKDIVQEIFIWLWEHRSSTNIQQLIPYLKSAIKFKAANYIRSGNIREGFFEQLVGNSALVQVLSAEELVEVKELKGIIQQAILDLPDKCQKIFRLSREQHLTNLEIAEQLKISIKTVENQMTIALKKMHHSMDAYSELGVVLLLVTWAIN